MNEVFLEGMLGRWFIRVLNMSLTASLAIVAVLLLRFCLKRQPKMYSYVLWAVVLFRLLCPVSLSLPVSFLGFLRTVPVRGGELTYIPEEIGLMREPEVYLPGTAVRRAVNGSLPQGNMYASANPLQIYLFLGAAIWFLGVAVMLLYGAVSYGRLLFRLRLAGPVRGKRSGEVFNSGKEGDRTAEGGIPESSAAGKKSAKSAVGNKSAGNTVGTRVYLLKNLEMPFVCGLFRPRIYLPEDLTEEEREYILLHEEIHIRRGDPITRTLGYTALCLHWFNPLVWLAWRLSARDMERSCDEAVIGRLGQEKKKAYSRSLLAFASGKHRTSGMPLAFGEGDTGSRIRNILLYRKPAFAVACTVTVLCAVLAGVLLVNPGGDGSGASGSAEETNAETGTDVPVTVNTEAGTYGTGTGTPGTEDSENAEAEPGMVGMETVGTETAEAEPGTPGTANTDPDTSVATEPASAEAPSTAQETPEADAPTFAQLMAGERDGAIRMAVRSLSRSARCFDRYVNPDFLETEQLGDIMLAEDCVFLVNYEMDRIDYQEVDFDTFADLMAGQDEYLNRACTLTFQNGLVTEAALESALEPYGITFSPKTDWESDRFREAGRETALKESGSLLGTYRAELSDAAGEERIEIRMEKDQTEAAVLIYGEKGDLLYAETANTSRAGWNNIYLGRTETGDFLLTVHIEDREEFGVYTYEVFRLKEEGGIAQIAGSSFEWGGLYQYDGGRFRQWADGLERYLGSSFLLLSSQEAEFRTGEETELGADLKRYGYDALRVR